MKNRPIPPKPGQESVWDYPRPPRVEPITKHLEVWVGDVQLASTNRGFRVLETSHPPNYYFPPEDVVMKYLVPSERMTFCEWKGKGRYYHIHIGKRIIEDAVWYYADPKGHFVQIKNYLSFYPALMDTCIVGGEVARPQAGRFYGGWITDDIVGPFKGEPGTWGW